MGTLFLSEIKKQASSFLQEKYKVARLVFTDVTPAELLVEQATNDDPCSIDTKTMTRICEAAFEIEDYWRIVDVLHQRLYTVDWKQWRQSYKALVLLDFLLTHGPESVAQEFLCHVEIIQELGYFKHVDERGFNWGSAMQKKSERIIELMTDSELLQEARSKALKVSKEIQGFGNLLVSPSSSFSSNSTSTRPAPTDWNEQQSSPIKDSTNNSHRASATRTHIWDTPSLETGSLLDPEDHAGGTQGNCSSFLGTVIPENDGDGKFGLRSLSDVGKVVKKRFDRQFSLGF